MPRKPYQPEPPAPVGPILKAIELFQARLIDKIGDCSKPPTPDEVKTELAAVTRVAAAAGNVDAAIKGYDTLGKMMGLGGETHNHLHLHQTPGAMLAASDGELAEMLNAAKAKPALLAPEPAGTSGTRFSDSCPLHATDTPEVEALLA